MNYRLKKTFLGVLFTLLCACVSNPPKNTDDLCAVFAQKPQWLAKTNRAYQKWGVSVPIQMAIMQQESRFVADAAPSGGLLFGLIPVSSAYGYAQAIDGTWESYLEANNSDADRDDFAAACDFIGWYSHQSQRRLGIKKSEAYHLYLAYHEGHGGYQRKSYQNKRWLLKVARKVARQAENYQQQLSTCQAQ